jgi:DNA (cytosine-5)-methyltransferase 1
MQFLERWWNQVNSHRPSGRRKPVKGEALLGTISLFTGAGGLDLGLEAAGFDISVCVESDKDSRDTLARNRPHWKLSEPGDVFRIQPADLLKQSGLLPRQVALLVGGPPCQPFSKSGYWATGKAPGVRDPRASTLSALLRIAEAVLPRVILLENVRGLVSGGGSDGTGLDLIDRELRQINQRNNTNYQPQVLHLNAADFGVPQLRERVFVLASIDGKVVESPLPTHGKDAKAYLTAWDAIGHLDKKKWSAELKPAGKWGRLLASIPEGKNYLWLTPKGGGKPLFGWRTKYWSFLLKLSKKKPSWTIQANPGPATGPFHWRSRMLSVEEILRLQTFPKGYKISGDRRSAYRQVGNAVPSVIGELLGREIRSQLLGCPLPSGPLTLIPARRKRPPGPCKPSAIPRAYQQLVGPHAAHPGPGLGPRRTKQAQQSPGAQVKRAVS